MTHTDSMSAVMLGRVTSAAERKPGANARNRAAAQAIAEALFRAIVCFRQWRQLSRSRRELSTLDEYQLRDIGLSRSQAVFESGKSFLQY